MKSKMDRKKSCGIVAFPERAVREQSMELSRAVAGLVSQNAKKIVFDMGKTEMIDSATLGVLIHARREHPINEIDMIILNATGYVKSLLENAKFTFLFHMETSEAKS